jgi:hypothetical protein
LIAPSWILQLVASVTTPRLRMGPCSSQFTGSSSSPQERIKRERTLVTKTYAYYSSKPQRYREEIKRIALILFE